MGEDGELPLAATVPGHIQAATAAWLTLGTWRAAVVGSRLSPAAQGLLLVTLGDVAY